jgi:hypothetical protein
METGGEVRLQGAESDTTVSYSDTETESENEEEAIIVVGSRVEVKSCKLDWIADELEIAGYAPGLVTKKIGDYCTVAVDTLRGPDKNKYVRLGVENVRHAAPSAELQRISTVSIFL